MTQKTTTAAAALDPSLPALPPVLARLGRTLALLAILLGPLLVLPPSVGLFNALDTPRRLALFLCAGLMAALLVLSWARRGRIIWRWHPLDLPVGLFALAAVLSSLASAYPAVSLGGPLWAQDGLLLTVTVLLLYLGVKTFLRTIAEIEQAVVLTVLVGGLVAVIGLVDFAAVALHIEGYTGMNSAFSGVRLVATMGNSMFTGTYLLMCIPLGVGAAMAATCPKRRAALIAAVLLMLPALLLTQARAAWVALVLTVPVYLLMVGKIPGQHRAMTRAAWGVIGLMLVLVLGIALGVPAVRHRLASTVNLDDATIRTRLVYMRGSFNAFAARPVTGWGVGTVRNVFPQFRPASNAREMGMALDRGFSTAQPHNLFIQLAAEMGLFGLAAFVFLLVMLLRAGWRLFAGSPKEAWLGVGLLGLLTAYTFVNTFAFDNAATMSGFWIALGLLAALTARDVPLAPRLGGLAAPLSPASVRGLALAGLVIGLGTLLHTGAEVAAAGITLQAATHLSKAVTLAQEDPKSAFTAAVAAEQTLQRSLAFTAQPDLRRGVRVGDVRTYEIWTEILRAQLELLKPAPTREGFEAFHKFNKRKYDETYGRFMDVSARGLQLLDRDPTILRTRIRQFQLDAKLATGTADEEALRSAMTLAHEDIEQLHAFEPTSAEIYLLAAEMAALQATAKDANLDLALSYYAEAQVQAYRATELDPTFAEAYTLLAMYQNEQVVRGSPDTPNLVPAICENYIRAERLGLHLGQADRMVYATNLFLAGRVREAIAQGTQLDPALRASLKAQVRTIYRIYKRPTAELERTLKLLDADEAALTAPAGPLENLLRR